jgi:Domain of unknown function (DUF1992)
MNAEEKREQRLKMLEDDIGRHLTEAAASGELRSAPSWGRPLNLGDGYEETPAELRMAMKVLKDAGVVPPEVELMQQIAALQAELTAQSDPAAARVLRQRISDQQQKLALRLERLRHNPSL